MEYVTIFESFKRNEINILSNIFEQHGLQYRVLKMPVDNVVPKGFRLQVEKRQKDRAFILLRENGFLGSRLANADERPSGKFWIYLFFALMVVLIVAFLIVTFTSA